MSDTETGQADATARACLLRPLEQVRNRVYLYLSLEGAVHIALALLALGSLQLAFDRWLRFSVDQRVALNIVISLAWGWVVYRRVLRPLRCKLPDHTLATAVDRLYPELNDQIATAVQFAKGQAGPVESNSPELMRAVVEATCAQAHRVSFLSALNHRRAKHRIWELSGLLGLALAAFIIMPETMFTWFHRNWMMREIPWPQATYLKPIGFEYGQRHFPRGDELHILALTEGRVPRSVTLQWETPTARSGRETMTKVGDLRWEISLGLLTEDLTFRMIGGDERTPEYAVRAIDRPRIEHITIQMRPPGYTGLEPVTLEQQTVLELLRGSSVQIDAALNKPVRGAQFVGPRGPVGVCDVSQDAAVALRWDAPDSGTYEFELTDHFGWSNRRPIRFTLKVLPDRPPEIEFKLHGVGESVTPHAQVPVSLAVRDAYGLSDVRLFVQRDEQPPFEVPLDDFEPGPRVYDTQFRFAVSSVGAEPGQRLRVWVEALDVDPDGPNVGRFDPITLRVLSVTDFLAELAKREYELRSEFERLITAQTGLNDALLRLLPALPTGAAPAPAEEQQLAGLARRQDGHARRTLTIQERFEQILAEMRTNKVGRTADVRRIQERIAGPLNRLCEQRMPRSSKGITQLRNDVSVERIDALSVLQVEIVREMRAILSNMLEWEGYREAVALLSVIIEEQTELRAATTNALEDELDAILGLDEVDQGSPRNGPKP